ncbi:MAG: hypothetical protein ACD_41C00156G0006 [uncultured bacterium]|nr:MAG: hypothetical protein ACD_41C00156G0006 [uncultured bacterium]
MHKPELRKDYIQEKFVLIAPLRNRRPHQTVTQSDACPLIRPEDSPFSPQNISNEVPLARVGGKRNWKVCVVGNKFPAVTLDNPKAYGEHEVVVETPNPNVHLEDLPTNHVADILSVYAQRTAALTKNPRLHYVLIFKNSGGRAGASLCHAHSQIFATEFIPPHILDKSTRAQAYRAKHGTCVYCQVMGKERRSRRFVWEDKNVVVFCPYASMYNYEVWILPKRHRDNITLLNQAERTSWAHIMKRLLFAINHKLLLPYNYYFHQLIDDPDQHLYMKLVPRGSAWAGVEIGSGLIINQVPPEEAATFYRAQLKRIK